MATSNLPADDLPNSNDPALVLRHPTATETVKIVESTFAAWSDSLTPALYLEESTYLTSVPLARNGGMTTWILVHKDHAPGERRILCSCESFVKRSLTSDVNGKVNDNIVHGIASVFCPALYRRRGYAARMMNELAKGLHTWQKKELPCVGTTLYSDIGKEFYAKLGWVVNATNTHIEIQSEASPWPSLAKAVTEDDLEDLCRRDEALVRSRIAGPTTEFGIRFTIIPDSNHMGWHIGKEIFATRYLFGRTPKAKGAIAGLPGSQVWALWTHRYYSCHDVEPRSNVLYILRLVLEVDETATRLPSDATKRPVKEIYDEQITCLRAILQAAQAEASEWKLDVVKLWDPTPLVLDLLAQSSLQYDIVERDEDSIASLFWYDNAGSVCRDAPLWVNNEHYAWQ